MFNKRKYSELRVVILLLLIVLIVCVSGVFLYKNISAIAKNVETSAKAETRHSLVLRQILIDIGEAENSVKSYNLTYDKEHLISFYNSISSFESKIEELQKAKKYSKHEKYVIDNVTQLAEKRFELLKQQLYLDDEEKITDELNTISLKIDEAYKKNAAIESASITSSVATSDPVKKERFFKRLFGKKSKTPVDTVKTISPALISKDIQSKKIQGELKSTVTKVKGLQLEKLAERKSVELQLSKEGQTIVNQIRKLAADIESQENVQALKKIDSAKRDMNTIKRFAIAFSVVISLLLIFVGYLITNYVRKKKEYELALITAKRSAEDLAKTKETFLANMSHEIKTPLNAIYGFTEQVLNSNLNAQQYEHLNIVKKSADYLSKLVNNILSYSKIQAGKAHIDNVSFNLKEELVDVELLFLEQTKKKALNLIFEKDKNVPDHINCDLTKLKQILFNLIGNAVKFTEKGSVEVLVKKTEFNSRPALFIRVRDTGIGISKEKLPDLFNEYAQANTTLSKRYEGTGLGLVITKKLIEQMGGTISFVSKERVGTTVETLVPYSDVSQPQEDNGINHSISSLQKSLKGKKILIVDDEDFNRLLLKSILSKYKVIITEAADGNKSVLLTSDNSYDFVIMDIQMPDKNGIEACIEIRKNNKQVPIFASSAGINEEKISEYLNVGFTGFVHKPFTEQELLETLMRQLSNTSNDLFITREANDQKHISSKVNISNLQTVYDNDEDFKKELIEIFLKSISNALADITNACVQRKWLQAADAAHKAMPPCKHFDADDLYRSFKYFENLRNNIPDNHEMQINLEQLKQEIESVNSELKLYL